MPRGRPRSRRTLQSRRRPHVNRKETVRFDSFRFQTFRQLIDSVRFGSELYFSRFDAVRLAFFGHVMARSSSVRFRVRFRPVPEFNGLVRFGSVRPVRFGFSFLPVYIYIYVYVYTCVYIYIYIYTCVYIYIYDVYACVYVCIYIYRCVYMCVYIYIYTYVYVCIYICICIYLSLSIYIYI